MLPEVIHMARASKLLKIGDRAPDFRLPDARTGEEVGLSDLLGQPLLIYFGRGTWCPTCRRYMAHLRKTYGEVQKRGARAVVIMAQNPDRMREYLEENAFPFPVLADASRKVVKEYGVYVRVNFESINIARPANFVLDGDGIIRYIFIASVQVETPPEDEILAALEAAAD